MGYAQIKGQGIQVMISSIKKEEPTLWMRRRLSRELQEKHGYCKKKWNKEKERWVHAGECLSKSDPRKEGDE